MWIAQFLGPKGITYRQLGTEKPAPESVAFPEGACAFSFNHDLGKEDEEWSEDAWTRKPADGHWYFRGGRLLSKEEAGREVNGQLLVAIMTQAMHTSRVYLYPDDAGAYFPDDSTICHFI